MIPSVITLVVCYLTGLCLLLPRDGKSDLGANVGLALPVGSVVWSVTGYASLVVGVPMTPETLYATCAITAAILVVVRRPSFPGAPALLVLLGGVLVLVFSMLAIHAVRITMDSALMAYMADEMQAARGLASHVMDWYFMAYPILVPLLSVPSLATVPEHLPAFMPAFTVSSILLLASQVFKAARASGMSTAFCTLTALGAASLVFLSHHMLFQATYLNGHVIAATLILGFFAVRRTNSTEEICLAARGACVIGIVFLRLEGALVGILMVAMGNYAQGTEARSRIILASLLAGAATLYQGGVLLVSDPVINFASLLNTKLACSLVSATWLFIGGLVIVQKLRWIRIERALPAITLAGLVVGVTLLTVATPSHMLRVIVNLYENMLWTGGWGPTWIVLWVGFFGGILLNRDALKVSGVLFVMAYVLLVIALGGIYSIPYRSPGFLDSGNRIMVHVLPLMALAVVSCWLGWLARFKVNVADSRHAGVASRRPDLVAN